MSDDTDLITPKEAADLARVSRSTINNALKSKSLFGQQDNRLRWKIKRPDVLAWANRYHADKPTDASAKTAPKLTHATRIQEAPDTALIAERAELRATVKGLQAKLEASEALTRRLEQDVSTWQRELETTRQDAKERITALEEERRDLMNRLVEASKPRGLFGFLRR